MTDIKIHNTGVVLLSVMLVCSNGRRGAEAPGRSPALAFSSSIPFSRSTRSSGEELLGQSAPVATVAAFVASIAALSGPFEADCHRSGAGEECQPGG